jgi:hypothetical protein
VTFRKYVPGVKSAGGEAAGKLATICVAVAVCTVNVTPPSFIAGPDPKLVPAIVIVLSS